MERLSVKTSGTGGSRGLARQAVFAMAVSMFFFGATSAAQGKIVGVCKFDTTTLKFAGSPTVQASCLLRKVSEWAHVAHQPADLPDALSRYVGAPVSIDDGKLRSLLANAGVSEVLADLNKPVSHGSDGDLNASEARYFVIHDTSAPLLAGPAFPSDIDTSPKINALSHFATANSPAHVFIDRSGKILVGHDFSVPWRATKLESKVVGTDAKGLFLHVESVQPRIPDPKGKAGNDAIAPVPGLSDAQYEKLALIYILASRRAGTWLIPAFHAAIDDGITDGHDDPQNFELSKFCDKLEALRAQLK